MNRRNAPAYGAPSRIVHRQGHALLVIQHQVRTQDRSNARVFCGTLELDGAIYSVGVGTGERGKTAGRSRGDHDLRAGGPLAHGEPGMGMEVGKHPL